VPESSSASTTVSARVLYAAVLRMGSVVEAIVEETAAVALDIYKKCVERKKKKRKMVI
jgi:threonine dehydratase